MHILVQDNLLTCGNRQFRCAIGKGGFSVDKKEGGGCTPIGTFLLRECWYRADRLVRPVTGLPVREIHESDGWCDDSASAEYNRPIVIPSPPCGERGFSFEYLWRSDHVYDLIVPLGYNDDPVVTGKGSAIFLHVARENHEPTEGCVALALEDLLEVLTLCDSGTVMEIRAG